MCSLLTNHQGHYVDISKLNQSGGIDAYVIDSEAENLVNWLKKNNIAVEIAETIRKKYSRITLISGIRIEEEYRGQGKGTAFIENVIASSQSEQAKAILLLVDIGEINDFDLVSWYQSFGFEIIGYDGCNYPLMLRDVAL